MVQYAVEYRREQQAAADYQEKAAVKGIDGGE